ncbi:MAG: tol-pal system YbgF family protein, partial [Pyrinomonadaceae bacterium]
MPQHLDSKLPIIFFRFSIVLISLLAALTIACSAQTEEQALDSLRQIVRGGMEPTEEYVASIASRFSGKRAGALARLLHAKIKFEKRDFAGAAALLSSDDFARKTKIGDYASWLRGRALHESGKHAEAVRVLNRFQSEFPDSILSRDARLVWADSMIQSGQAAAVTTQLGESRADPGALLRIARAYEARADQIRAIQFYRRTYFDGAGTDEAKEAEAKLISMGQNLTPTSADEAAVRAEKLIAAKNWAAAEKAYSDLRTSFPAALTPAVNLKRITVYSNLRTANEAASAFASIPASAVEREEAYYHLAQAYARAKNWPQARTTLEAMHRQFPNGRFTAKAWIDAGMEARAAKNRLEEQALLRAAVANLPNAVEVAAAQFELAWIEHDRGDHSRASQMLIEHLARYVDKDTTNRGKAGYWAARESELAGRFADACALYDGVIYRYSANWYGHLAQQRLQAIKSQGRCSGASGNPLVTKAIANLRTVTVAPETSGPREMVRIEKSVDLSHATLDDWAINELETARRTAQNSPKINLALAKRYRERGDNVNAFLALAKSYPDYSQMFPEEMGREEWDI